MGDGQWRLGVGPAHGGSGFAPDRGIEEPGRRQAIAALATAASPASRGSMTIPPKALIGWSSGKDSGWALHEVRRAGGFEIVGALTTVTDAFGRVSMHGVREGLLREQLGAVGLPPVIVHIPFPCPNEVYEQKMAEAMGNAKASGVTYMIFGDLFLEDVRAYRERHLAG